MADLRAGRGMGLALAAELNGYPGPRQALEHADALVLTPEQLQRTQALFEAMLAETVPIGEQVIEGEGELEQLFASRSVTPASLVRTTDAIAAAMGALRAAHLGYHLAMMEVLTAEQVRRYGELRGHGSGHSDGGQGHDVQPPSSTAHGPGGGKKGRR